jgi:hypothetical protein
MFEGETFEVERPQVIPFADVAGAFSAADQRMSRLFAVGECLRLTRAREVAARAA